MTEQIQTTKTTNDLPLSTPADVFYKEFQELINSNNMNRIEFEFPDFAEDETAFKLNKFSMKYNDGPYALYNISLKIPKNKITAIIGPSGCGKSTLLRSINRMNEELSTIATEGEIILDNKNIISNEKDKGMNKMLLRTKVGMVFQRPQPFPRSIYDNIAFGPRLQGIKSKEQLDEIVETTLKDVGLWSEVKHRLNDHAYGLSGGQQQRLCIARCIAVNPRVILFDEPASALDPRSTYQIEDLLIKLKKEYTIVIVTHNMQEAARISDYSMFLYNGNVIEFTETDKMFENPFFKLTKNYISGRFG